MKISTISLQQQITNFVIQNVGEIINDYPISLVCYQIYPHKYYTHIYIFIYINIYICVYMPSYDMVREIVITYQIIREDFMGYIKILIGLCEVRRPY